MEGEEEEEEAMGRGKGGISGGEEGEERVEEGGEEVEYHLADLEGGRNMVEMGERFRQGERVGEEVLTDESPEHSAPLLDTQLETLHRRSGGRVRGRGSSRGRGGRRVGGRRTGTGVTIDSADTERG